MTMDICPICDRDMPQKSMSKHHMIPSSRGGKSKDIVVLHKICHDKLHSVFTEKEMEKHYHTIDRLKEHEDIQKFIKWISRKDPMFYDSSKRSKRKK